MFTFKKIKLFFPELIVLLSVRLRFGGFGLGAEVEQGRHGLRSASNTCEYRTRLLLLIVLLILSTLSRLCNTRLAGRTRHEYIMIFCLATNLSNFARNPLEKKRNVRG